MGAWIEKMQEMFNKDLEELNNKQSVMNNIITEMKNTLQGINSRITEAEERISELEDRMVPITAMEQKKQKRMKRNEDSIRDSGTTLNAPTFELYVSQKEKRERKDLRKYLKRL